MADKELKIHLTADSNLAEKAGEGKEALDKLNKSAQESTEATKKETAETGELDLKKRELLESIRELTHEYPILGEVARAAFNPLTIAAFGVAEALHIWIERLQTAQNLLGAFELPDFTTHAAGVSAAADAYDKLTTAVAGADTEFNGAADAFERQSKAIQAQLDATKKLIEAQKQKAQADLDIQRAEGKVSPSTYAARKAMIEQGANDQTVQAEIDARNADLAAKGQEVTGLWQQSTDETKKAKKIQPGRTDAELDQLIKETQDAAAKAEEQAKELRQKEALAKSMAGQEGLESFTPESIATQFKYDTTFGATTNPNQQAKIAEDAAKNAEATQAHLEEQSRQLQKQKEERTKHNEEAAHLAGEAETKRQEYNSQLDPKKPGTVAWQNAQDTATQKKRDITSNESRFAQDIDQFNKDATEYTKNSGRPDPESINKARQAMKDMYDLVNDMTTIVRTLAAEHQNVSLLARDVADAKSAIALLQSQMRNGRLNFHG